MTPKATWSSRWGRRGRSSMDLQRPHLSLRPTTTKITNVRYRCHDVQVKGTPEVSDTYSRTRESQPATGGHMIIGKIGRSVGVPHGNRVGALTCRFRRE